MKDELNRVLAEAEAVGGTPSVASLFEEVYETPLRQQREQREELERAIESDPRVLALHPADG